MVKGVVPAWRDGIGCRRSMDVAQCGGNRKGPQGHNGQVQARMGRKDVPDREFQPFEDGRQYNDYGIFA